MSERLEDIAAAMVADGKGLLAADESTGTIKKRFDAIGVESTPENRRDYRELMLRTTGAMRECISGVILYDETIRQDAADGTPLIDIKPDRCLFTPVAPPQKGDFETAHGPDDSPISQLMK